MVQGLAGKGAAPEAQTAAPKRKRRSDAPTSGRRDGGEGLDPGAPQPKRAASNNKCEECGTTETPTWRRWGPTLLCNACGLRRKKSPKSAGARAVQPPAAAAAAAAFQGAAWVAGPEPGSALPNAASPQHQQ